MGQISTLSAYNSIIANLLQAENQQNQADVQVSSGKVASDLEGFGTNAEALTSAQQLQTRVNGYVQTASNVSAQLQAQDAALTEVSDAGQNARQAIADAVASGSANGLMASLQSAYSQVVDGLNTQYNGAYLFSGGNVNTAAVSVQQLSDLPTSSLSGVFQNDQLAQSAQMNETTTLTTGFLASNIATPLFQAFQALQAVNNGPDGPLSGTLTAAQQTDLTNLLQTFDSANSGMTETVAQNGLLQNQVSNIQTAQTQRQTDIQTTIGNMADVDMGQASANLSQAQTALQASARVFESLQSTSLLNYLGSSGTLG
jgi:flagellar hook-associated protein 3 FlgL